MTGMVVTMRIHVTEYSSELGSLADYVTFLSKLITGITEMHHFGVERHYGVDALLKEIGYNLSRSWTFMQNTSPMATLDIAPQYRYAPASDGDELFQDPSSRDTKHDHRRLDCRRHRNTFETQQGQ